MDDCTYELYALTFKAATTAVKAGDRGRLAAMRARAAGRTRGVAEACLLAIDDAEARVSRRSKTDVCRARCVTRCERAA